MSYLDFPRLHFSGLFYTGPSTINNITQNYMPSVQLENAPNQYDPNVALWNPMGVAQWWMEECTVLSAIGPKGAPVGASDAVIGAAVQTPSPTTPMSDGQGGFYDIAKMVDLDPDQQGRSALYGVRISVTLPNGAGLQGLMTVPELRQLNGRIPVRGGSWTAVGNWMGTLQDVQWNGDISSSQLLTDLKAASAGGLAVKLTVDLHQNNPKNVFTSGDLFCYGRVLGSIGPALAGELAQVVPGRCLQTAAPPQTAAAVAAAAPVSKKRMQPRERVIAQMAAIADARENTVGVAAAAAAPSDPWNPAFAVIRQVDSQTLLSLDIGGSIFLKVQRTASGPTSDGTFEVDSGISVGVFDLAKKSFVAFANGGVGFTTPNQYQPLVSTSKNCMLVKNSGVFVIPLTSGEATSVKTNPLAISVNGKVVAQELSSGLWMDVSLSSERLQCGSGDTSQAQLMVRQFGNPLANQAAPVTSLVQLVEWIFENGEWTNPQTLPTSTDVSISIGKTDENGLAQITTTMNVADITLPGIRQPLDSQVYYISLADSDGNVIGDQQATLSVLLWKAFQAPANPSWADIGAVFSAYARLYPGMKARLDISDQQTVVGFAPSVLSHMTQPISDPAYMPVTRDLSPSKMKMIVSWLQSLTQNATGSNS